MAHTIKAYYYTDPATAVTVDFMGAVADNDGIAVDAYQMGVPGIDQARNGSLYSDTPRPVWSKHGTVTDVLTVTVRGSSNTALYTNLKYLAKLGEYARTGSQNPRVKATPYLELTPSTFSGAQTLYAPIYDCRVEMPPDWAGVSSATTTIEDVTVTIERGLWQSYVLGAASFTSILSAANAASASSASSSSSIAGDTVSLYQLELTQAIGSTTINRVIIGYRSKSLGGANYDSLGKKEAESQTNGTDTTDAADATASGGNKVECTFATGALATRLSGTGIPYGIHRVFARMKVTGSQVATVKIKYQDTNSSGAVYSANDSVSVSSTSWLVYDLGVVRYYEAGLGAVLDPTSTGVWALDASGTPAAGNLDVDWVYFMPTEGYLTASGVTMVVDDILRFDDATYPGLNVQLYHFGAYSRISSLQYTASFQPVPGACALYWIAGTDSGAVFDSGITETISVTLSSNPRSILPTSL